MKTLFFCLLCKAAFPLAIVFIHLGSPSLPDHLTHTLSQARAFNPDVPIYLVAPVLALEDPILQELQIKTVSCESLSLSEPHKQFLLSEGHMRTAGGFWIHTTERFFYLEELIEQYELQDVFHLENDVLLYRDLNELQPIFAQHYQGKIGATFERDGRCVAGFFYISNALPLQKLVEALPKKIVEGGTDMESIAQFKIQCQNQWIDELPIVCPAYFENPEETFWHGKTEEPMRYTNHIEAFDSLFDAAAIGVYLAGWNARFHLECHPGEISPHCVFDASHFQIQWNLDEKERKIPFLLYEGKSFRLNNLHLTNKCKIPEFLS